MKKPFLLIALAASILFGCEPLEKDTENTKNDVVVVPTPDVEFGTDLVIVSPIQGTVTEVSFSFTGLTEGRSLEVVNKYKNLIDVRMDYTALEDGSGNGTIRFETIDARVIKDQVKLKFANSNLASFASLDFVIAEIDNQLHGIPSLSENGGSFELNVLCEAPYTVSVEQDSEWLSYTKSNNDLYVFTADENPDKYELTARVTVSLVDIDYSKSFTARMKGGEDARLRLTEYEAMCRIYDAMDGDNWPEEMKKNWKSDRPLNEWAGVKIFENRVWGLRFYKTPGIIPVEIGVLKYLVSLEYDSPLTTLSTVPDTVTEFLYLSKFWFHHCLDETLAPLPETIQYFSHKTPLYIHDDYFCGTIPEYLAEYKIVAIGNNCFSGKVPEVIHNSSWWNDGDFIQKEGYELYY